MHTIGHSESLSVRFLQRSVRSTQIAIEFTEKQQGVHILGKGANVTSAGWQVILCDPIWRASSRSGEASCELLYSVYLFTFTFTYNTDA